jgi:hypothetical protein
MCRRGGNLLALLLLGLTARDEARAQVFVVTGGSSSTSNAHGGSLEFRTDKRIGRLDLGVFGKPSLGFSLQQTYRNLLINAGDQQMSLTMPTDISGASYYFLGRGISIQRKKPASQMLIFAGATSNGFHAPFLNVSRAESITLAFLGERRLTPSLRWVSRNLLSHRQTFIQSLEWSGESVRMAVSGGLGGNQPYWASTLTFDKHWLIVDAGYSKAGDAFRRVVVSSPQFSENDRENIRVQLAPVRNLRVVASRNHYVAPEYSGLSGRATVNGLGFWTSIAGTEFHGSLFRSATASGRSQALALGTRRALTRRVEGSLDVLSNARLFSNNSTFVATIREMLNARLTLNQVLTRSRGQTTISYGGSLLSNLVSVTAEYQTVFLPFVSAGPQQFKQVLMLGLHFQLPHGIQVKGDTNVSPSGRVHYTSYATSYGYRAISVSPGASSSGGFFRYLVRGRIVDAEGNPLEGAAVLIGKELAFTNSQGSFFLRLRNAQTVPFAVALDDFVIPGRYEVVSAPSQVSPAPDGEAQNYDVVVRRLPNAPAISETNQPEK